MTTSSMMLRHICFTGPKADNAELEFGPGLNLIYGASNTGKSSLLDAIDFMLGRESQLKEIPEHEGYDQLFMGIEFSNEDTFTLVRNISGGEYYCYKGLHKSRPDGVEPEILRAKKATKKFKSLTQFIFSRIDLENKKLKKNARNETVSLTLRNFLPLSLITETEIQKEASPYISEQYTKITEDSSRLKLLLTGVDDSSLIPAEKEKRALSRQVRIQLLEELVTEQEGAISDHIDEGHAISDFKDQQEKLKRTIQVERNELRSSETRYNQAQAELNLSRQSVNTNIERANEIEEMLARFELLEDQYASDIMRLEAITEAGSLITALPSSFCPLCGADQEDHLKHEDCSNNIEETTNAASSEIEKVSRLQLELRDTITQLKAESVDVSNSLDNLRVTMRDQQLTLNGLMPDLSEKRDSYTKLVETNSEVEKSIYLLESLEELQEKIKLVEAEEPDEIVASNEASILPTNGLYQLSQTVKTILDGWNLSNVGNIHFDTQTNDFVLGGKHRQSNGKGHRALTHAAATLGLLKHTEINEQANLGFVVLDSPLLAYEEPENEADDLSGTDINKHFFDSLKNWKTRQTIVFENKKSIPVEYSAGEQITYFTKNENSGRYGFFPLKRAGD